MQKIDLSDKMNDKREIRWFVAIHVTFLTHVTWGDTYGLKVIMSIISLQPDSHLDLEAC